ncbi:Rmf/CrpP family protein [Mesorhizobium sp. IMUNJ 23232]|uniref:ribosome modulation factor n=1 Tax=Mesorhizobium sp. IMUNJ 23232 TaxID=3376064 RepID=UPI00379009A9
MTLVVRVRMSSGEIIDEGTDAYCARTPRSACPYEPNTNEHRDWLRGWDGAEEIDLEDKVVHLSDLRKG